LFCWAKLDKTNETSVKNAPIINESAKKNDETAIYFVPLYRKTFLTLSIFPLPLR